MIIKRQARRKRKPARAPTFPAKRHEQPTRVIEHLYVFKMGVRDINVSVTVNGYAFGHGKISGGITLLTNHADRIPIQAEQLHSEIAAVRNNDSIAAANHVCRKIEFARGRSSAPDATNQLAFQIKDSQVVGSPVYDKQALGYGRESDTDRPHEIIFTESPSKRPAWIQFDHLVTFRVGDEQPIPDPHNAHGCHKSDIHESGNPDVGAGDKIHNVNRSSGAICYSYGVRTTNGHPMRR